MAVGVVLAGVAGGGAEVGRKKEATRGHLVAARDARVPGVVFSREFDAEDECERPDEDIRQRAPEPGREEGEPGFVFFFATTRRGDAEL